MRKLILGITIGFLIASTLAWAFTVKFPNTLKIRGFAFVDEAGNVLGGVTPTTVDVVNMPTSLDVNVTSLPAGSGGGGGRTVVTAYGTTTCPTGFSSLYVGEVFVLRDNGSGPQVIDGDYTEHCWQSQPLTLVGNGDHPKVGDCVVCIES